MATSYDYYRTSYPGWGTAQLQFRSPPAPAFQPLPSWTGWDYYRAHAYNPDHGLFYSIMNRTREMGSNGGIGVHEAKMWQRRVYSGLVRLGEILPSEIGAAAAYEAYRMWKHHRGRLFQSMEGASEREREGLIGLAIGEASRLWSYSGRPMDTYGQRDCLESAALTASKIAYTMLPGQGYPSTYGQDYAYPDAYDGYQRGRRYSNASQPVVVQQSNASPYGGAVPMALPSAGAGPGYPGGSPYLGGGVPAYAGSMGNYDGQGYASSYGGVRRSPSPFAPSVNSASPYLGAAQPAYAGYSGAPQAYAPAYGGAPMAYPGTAYSQPSYAQPQSSGYTITTGGRTVPAPPGSTIIITKGHSRRNSSSSRHRHHDFGIRRSRSADMRGGDRYGYI